MALEGIVTGIVDLRNTGSWAPEVLALKTKIGTPIGEDVLKRILQGAPSALAKAFEDAEWDDLQEILDQDSTRSVFVYRGNPDTIRRQVLAGFRSVPEQMMTSPQSPGKIIQQVAEDKPFSDVNYDLKPRIILTYSEEPHPVAGLITGSPAPTRAREERRGPAIRVANKIHEQLRQQPGRPKGDVYTDLYSLCTLLGVEHPGRTDRDLEKEIEDLLPSVGLGIVDRLSYGKRGRVRRFYGLIPVERVNAGQRARITDTISKLNQHSLKLLTQSAAELWGGRSGTLGFMLYGASHNLSKEQYVNWVARALDATRTFAQKAKLDVGIIDSLLITPDDYALIEDSLFRHYRKEGKTEMTAHDLAAEVLLRMPFRRRRSVKVKDGSGCYLYEIMPDEKDALVSGAQEMFEAALLFAATPRDAYQGGGPLNMQNLSLRTLSKLRAIKEDDSLDPSSRLTAEHALWSSGSRLLAKVDTSPDYHQANRLFIPDLFEYLFLDALETTMSGTIYGQGNIENYLRDETSRLYVLERNLVSQHSHLFT